MQNSFTNWSVNDLYHFGVRGMRWGQRRFQNEDGSLTSLGKERYGSLGYRSAGGMTRDVRKLTNEAGISRHYANTLTKKYRIDKLSAKQKKAADKGNLQKAEKLQNKISKVKKSVSEKSRIKAAKYAQNAQKATTMANKILKKAKKEGYKVSAKERTVVYRTGKQHALQVLAAAGAAVTSMTTATTMARYAPIEIGGNSYGVGIATIPITGHRTTETRYKIRKNR